MPEVRITVEQRAIRVAATRNDMEIAMRRRHHDRDRDRGLSALLKAMAIVIAVGMLVMVAGQSAYMPGGLAPF
jgi:hypothetical protein